MITWSSKSRRQVPTQRSATPFCHGLRKAVRVGSLPMSLTAESTSAPNFASRSNSKNRRLLVGPCLSQLLYNPKCIGISCRIEMQDLPPVVADDEKAVQNTKRERWDGEEIHCRNRLAMVSEERQPS